MNPPPAPGFFSGGGGGCDGNKPSTRKELLGPRPTALKVNKDSYKIRKPPIPPPPNHPPPPEAPPQPDDRQPVIIYAVSPKTIHTTVTDFMGLVQRLTGNAAGGSGAGNLSPAARLASMEKASPRGDREIAAFNSGGGGGENNQSSFMEDLLGDAAVELGRATGILSPAPASLPTIPAGMFSPAVDPLMMMGYNMFVPSPSSLFSAPMASPSPSSSSFCDPFNPFFDF